ncbi:MAG TPA: response regulator [Acidimicrobiales bacterium]|jgi:CheY-like chemotaxis protein|nr:response regulator [Acidimicrobiales bacterium]
MTLRALIVDDNAEFLAIARRLLERDGITVVGLASSSAEALRQIEDQDPDMILVDVDLGEESGFDLAERLCPATGGRPSVILISAYPELDLEDLLKVSSAIGFVSKPDLSAAAIIDVLDRGNRIDEALRANGPPGSGGPPTPADDRIRSPEGRA